SWSIQPSPPLASGRKKPSLIQSFFDRSNSRVTSASAPPRDSAIRQRVYCGRRQLAPCHTQFSPSALFSASKSSTVSHSGSALRYSTSVVRRQTPRSCCLSFQKL